MESIERSLARKTVLVTGAAGFIGSHLTDRLVRLGARTRALVRYTSTGAVGWLDRSGVASDVEIVHADIGDRTMVERAVAGADVVFHLAALIGIPYSYDAPVSYLRTNVEGTVNLLEAARKAGVGRFVHTSTSEVYGTAQSIPIDETHALRAQSPYAASKIAADKFAESFHHAFGLPVVTIRPFNTYGPRQSARAIVPTIVLQALEGTVVRLGNVEPTRDLIYVDDTVDGFIRAAACDAAVGSVIQLGTGRETSIRDVVGMVGRIVGRSLEVGLDDRRVRLPGSEVERLCASVDRARTLLQWNPAMPLEQGLAHVVEWIRANRDEYRAEAYAI